MQTFHHRRFHFRINRPINVQECNLRAVAPALVKNFRIRGRPRPKTGIRSINIKERLQRITRHLVYIKKRIHKARLFRPDCRNHRLLCKRIQQIDICRRQSLHSRSDMHPHDFPDVLVKRFYVTASIDRHGIGHIRFHRRLERPMAQEFHLDAQLIQQALVERETAAKPEPRKMRRWLHDNAIHA